MLFEHTRNNRRDLFFFLMNVRRSRSSSMDQLLSTRSPSPAKGVAQVLPQQMLMASIFYNSVFYFHSTMQNLPYIGNEFISRWDILHVCKKENERHWQDYVLLIECLLILLLVVF